MTKLLVLAVAGLGLIMFGGCLPKATRPVAEKPWAARIPQQRASPAYEAGRAFGAYGLPVNVWSGSPDSSWRIIIDCWLPGPRPPRQVRVARGCRSLQVSSIQVIIGRRLQGLLLSIQSVRDQPPPEEMSFDLIEAGRPRRVDVRRAWYLEHTALYTNAFDPGLGALLATAPHSIDPGSVRPRWANIQLSRLPAVVEVDAGHPDYEQFRWDSVGSSLGVVRWVRPASGRRPRGGPHGR